MPPSAAAAIVRRSLRCCSSSPYTHAQTADKTAPAVATLRYWVAPPAGGRQPESRRPRESPIQKRPSGFARESGWDLPWTLLGRGELLLRYRKIRQSKMIRRVEREHVLERLHQRRHIAAFHQ